MVIISADPCEQQKLLQLTLLSLYALFDVSDYSLMSLMTDDFSDTLMTGDILMALALGTFR